MIFRHIKSLANYLHCLTAMQLTRLWWHTAIEGTHNWKFTTSLLILYANFCIFFFLFSCRIFYTFAFGLVCLTVGRFLFLFGLGWAITFSTTTDGLAMLESVSSVAHHKKYVCRVLLVRLIVSN